MKALSLILSAILISGCATKHHCAVLHFNQKPNPELIFALAKTQNEDASLVAEWFNNGNRGFVLSTIHTNEIELAKQFGATVELH